MKKKKRNPNNIKTIMHGGKRERERQRKIEFRMVLGRKSDLRFAASKLGLKMTLFFLKNIPLNIKLYIFLKSGLVRTKMGLCLCLCLLSKFVSCMSKLYQQ